MTNVVLLTVDCLRYDRCGFNGWSRNTTPFLDQIATDSVVFDRAYAPGPQTSESFPGLLAGRHSHNNAVEYSYGVADAGEIQQGHNSIADEIFSMGMKTVAVVSNPSLSSYAGYDAGFKVFDNLRVNNPGSDNKSDNGKHLNLADFTNISGELLSKFKSKALSGDARGYQYRLPFIFYRFAQLRDWPTVDGSNVVSELSEKITDAAQDGSPVFAWGHLNDLHAPLHPKKANFEELFDTSSRELFNADFDRLTQRFSPEYNAAYEGVLRYVDKQVKMLVRDLKQNELWEDTILLLTADHGEALADRGYYGHPPHYLFNDCLRVPLLVRSPEIDGTRVSAPFSLTWLHELLSDLLDLPRFNLPAESGRESHIFDPEDALVIADSLTGIGYSTSIINKNDKYIRFLEDVPSILEQNFTTEWLSDIKEKITWDWEQGIGYRLSSQPGEHSPRNPKSFDSIYYEIADKLKENIEPQSPTKEELPSEVESRLKEIGYID